MIPILRQVYYALIEQKADKMQKKKSIKNVYVDQGFVFADQMKLYFHKDSLCINTINFRNIWHN